jgi:MFS family permease
MDTAGAVLGPLGALALLPLFSGNVRKVFWLAAIPGAVCVLLVWLGVSEVRPADAPKHSTSSTDLAGTVSWNKSVVVMLVAVGLFSLGNSSDLFLILRARNLGVRAALAPGLGLLFNLVYTSLSWPAGKLSDQIPRRTLVVLGYFAYAAVYLGFSLARGPQFVWFLFAAYGIYYAMTEGVLRAWIADLVPSSSRGSVFGAFNWLVGVAALPASLLAGWLWRHYSPPAPFFVSALLSSAAAALLLLA